VEELHPPALVSRSCLGTREFGFTIDEAASLVALDAAVDAGSNSVDTADV
jgi:aryl-alcohol dehydrogenase-like predicted oxidoreductase